jgi:hypothetical protein
VQHAEGTLTFDDGELRPINAEMLLRPLERTLRALSWTVVLLAGAMVSARMW